MATSTKKAPASPRSKARSRTRATAATATKTPIVPGAVAHSITLRRAEGPLDPDFRRFACPQCGEKHDITIVGLQTPGTWTIAFACLAGCGYRTTALPIT